MPPSWYRLYAIQIEMGRLSRLVDPETGQHQVCCGLCHCSRWDPTSQLARPLLASCVTDLTGSLVCLSQVNPKVKTWNVLNVGHLEGALLLLKQDQGTWLSAPTSLDVLIVLLSILSLQGSQEDLLLPSLASHPSPLHSHCCSPGQNLHSIRKVWCLSWCKRL